MHPLDISIFIAYMATMLGIGFYFARRHQDADDYYVGGRSMGSIHIGLSVVATDVGGGFSIGLGGLGFTMGLSGSWLLFTGLLGAWLAAVVLIPRIKGNPALQRCLTFPQIFSHFYSPRVALAAGAISAIGYVGFTSSQLLAGAKLASATIAGIDQTTALLAMGVIAVLYTSLGGLKAVIYTDTVQWMILMGGLIFIGLPVAWSAIGGWDGLVASVPPEALRFDNLTAGTIISWAVTIIPIWFIAMTLYQRIYACRDVKTARKAWFIAGLFEWPVMAMMGVLLGLFARAAMEQGLLVGGSAGLDPEQGLPMLLATILPVGLLGLMLSAYFSAILSTADSCLMAASGNIVTDILERFMRLDRSSKRYVRLSQMATLVIGTVSLLLAGAMTSVLDLMLLSYSFMVSGLLVPVIGALFWKRGSTAGALGGMLVGGVTTIALTLAGVDLPWALDPNIFGLLASLTAYVLLSYRYPATDNQPLPAT